jgi:hypothetical protein
MHGADPTPVPLGQAAMPDLPLPFGIPAQTCLCMICRHRIPPIGARTLWGLGRCALSPSPTLIFAHLSVLSPSGMLCDCFCSRWLGRDTARGRGTSANQRCRAWSSTCSRESTCASMHACRSLLLFLKSGCACTVPPFLLPCRMWPWKKGRRIMEFFNFPFTSRRLFHSSERACMKSLWRMPTAP